MVASGALKSRCHGWSAAPGKGDVEADLDDFVILGQHCFAHGDEPRVGGDIDEAADPLGLDFDVPALRPARQRPAVDRPGLIEQSHDLLVEPVSP